MSKSPSVLRFKRHAVKGLILLVVFIAACITSIDGVTVTGLFADPAGQVPVAASDVHGVIHFGVHVDFSFNPNFGEDSPPHPEDRIALSFRLIDANNNSQPISGAFDTTLVPDGDYAVIAAAAPFGPLDTGFGESAPFPFTIRNQRPVASAPPAPGPQDGPDASAPGARPDPVEPSPPQCMASVRTGNTEGAACDSPDPDNKRKDSG